MWVRKTTSTFLYALKNSFEKIKYQYILFSFLLFKPMQATCKGLPPQMILLYKRFVLKKVVWKKIVNNIFEVLSSYFKRIIFKP
jgi:hypothetical protein